MGERTEEELYAFDHVMTDLALEAHQVLVQGRGGPEIPGVRVETERREVAEISRVVIETDAGARAMGKAPGTYVTIEAPSLRSRNQQEQEQVSQYLAEEISKFFQSMQIGPEDPCLVVGLGNRNATPDALGPATVDELLVTRHLHEMAPPELRGGLRPVAAIAPGVLGLTGIETSEIIAGIVERIRPAVVICIDALASRSAERLGTTIQLADTGINPGAGIGNQRMGITRETIGVPVLAIGVPTVIHATTIVGDALDLLAQELGGGRVPPNPVGRYGTGLDPSRIRVRETQGGFGPDPGAYGASRQPDGPVQQYSRTGVPIGQDAFGLPIDPVQKKFMVQQLLGPYMGGMVVTPKEIDTMIKDIAACLGGGMNAALHPAIDLTNILAYLQG